MSFDPPPHSLAIRKVESTDGDVSMTTSGPHSPLEAKHTLLEKRLKLLEDLYQGLQGRLDHTGSKLAAPADDLDGSRPAVPEIDGPKDSEQNKSVDEEPRAIPLRHKILINKRDADSGERKDHDEGMPQKDRQKEVEYTFLLRKFIHEDEPSESEIEIFDPNLQSLLRDLLKRYPYHEYFSVPVTIKSPYESIVHNWDDLYEEAGKTGSDARESQTRSDLKCLLDTISNGSGDAKLDQYFQSRELVKKQKMITFDNLWTIFAPGTLVVGRTCFKEETLFIVEDNRDPWPMPARYGAGKPPWELSCLAYDWNGSSFQRHVVDIFFEEFDGQKPIASLPFHPLDLDPGKDEIAAKLLERGKLFRKFCTAGAKDRLYGYSGEAIFGRSGFRGVQKDDPDEDLHSSRLEQRTDEINTPRPTPIDGNVMVDFESYFKYGQADAYIGEYALSDLHSPAQCNCAECTTNSELQDMYKAGYDGATGKEEKEWDSLQFMLCPPRVLGYVLQEKRWAQLNPTCIQKLPEDEDSETWTKRLKLAGEDDGKETKELLMGLVKNHGSGRLKKGGAGYEIDDLVAQKGKGLIILLYGPPGVGKTSTAQTVAMAVRRPLFSIGVADVGTSAKKVESNLKRIFDLATAWKAVLLIDEADVFLQSRTRPGGGSTTERNALVSVFLHVLEYYQGVLILTTNQIAQFDVAVQSRIHIAIKYKELEKDQTIAIFEDFLSQFTRLDGVDNANEIRAYVAKEFHKKEFDGRQIRNIVTSAMGMARSKGERMNLDHIKHVVGIAEEFKKDLNFQVMQWKEAQKGTRY